VLFDTGVSPNGLADNMERPDLDSAVIEALVLSHGHFDHAGGFPGLARLRRREGLPITLHPLVWTRRRIVFPGLPKWQLPALSRGALEAEGFEVIERRQRRCCSTALCWSPARSTAPPISRSGCPFTSHAAGRDGNPIR
jgi:7,8-dihydropterin-6-yl-methyl-4-(beta-D-ribofuranosyl)aminobenzene 5'-phosphate synthase